MSSYRDIEAYQLAHELGLVCHTLAMKLPKYELYETGSQLRRASKSVSANIVEGYGRRRYKAEYVKFLTYAHASCDESIEWMTYIRELYPELAEKTDKAIAHANKTGGKINNFSQSVEEQHNRF